MRPLAVASILSVIAPFAPAAIAPVGQEAKEVPTEVDQAATNAPAAEGHPEIDPHDRVIAEALQLERVQVTAKRETFYNTIDRKTYNVGKDIQSTTGSASDLLQNVPSVQVDVEGNVSLRGGPRTSSSSSMARPPP